MKVYYDLAVSTRRCVLMAAKGSFVNKHRDFDGLIAKSDQAFDAGKYELACDYLEQAEALLFRK